MRKNNIYSTPTIDVVSMASSDIITTSSGMLNSLTGIGSGMGSSLNEFEY